MCGNAIVNMIIGAIIGGVATYIVSYFQNNGKVVLEDSKVELLYTQIHLNNPIIKSMNLELLFTNSCGHDRVIQNIEAFLYDGAYNHNLLIVGSNTKPADVIPSHGMKNLKYEMTLENKIELNGLAEIDNAIYLDLYYIKHKKKESKRIFITEFIQKDISRIMLY